LDGLTHTLLGFVNSRVLRMHLADPSDIRSATTHPNPYPFYARLAVEQPIYREDPAGAWVVASAEKVCSVLTSASCTTRPPGGEVPDTMIGSPVAEIYARLVRINNGDAHCPLKGNIVSAIDSVQLDDFARDTGRRAAALAAKIEPERDCGRLTKFIYALPVEAMGALVGVPADCIPEVGQWVGAFGATSAAAVTGIPAVTPELMAHGAEASHQLLTLFRKMADRVSSDDQHLLARMLHDAEAFGRPDRENVIANAIGLLAQGFAATSALTGGSLLAIAGLDEVREAVLRDRPLIRELVQEVLRCDPVTHSTPRFVTSDTVVAGQPMRNGDMIIVSLAAASRDPALNPDPNRFELLRKDRRYLEFGAGAHACAGTRIALLIVETAIEVLLDRKLPLTGLAEHVSYRPSAHIRMPSFAA
jgi:cytochrome P450